jgi:hypothetical protein
MPWVLLESGSVAIWESMTPSQKQSALQRAIRENILLARRHPDIFETDGGC